MSDYPSMSHVQHITFEGNDCVVMSPEEYGAALADLEAKDYELSALRAELTEARRQLKEASEQEPMFWYVPALSDDDEDALVLPARDGKCPSSYQTASAIPLYAAPVPQPAVKVGDSFFESWYSLYNPEGKSTKQTMREAYAAGLVDREGRTDWQPAVPEAVVKEGK